MRIVNQVGICILIMSLGAAGPCTGPLPSLSLPTWDANRFAWPMIGQNVRRTGQSLFNGPTSATPADPKNWTYTAVGGAAINMQAVVTDAAVSFGTWGVLRRNIADPPDQWDKSDGKWLALHLDARSSATLQEVFSPTRPALTPAGYLYAGRAKLSRDEFWVGSNNDFLVSFYNGTIEGTPCLDPDDGTAYMGRGDGRLFAIHPTTGAVQWSFQTFNPQLPDDPDGGGEIVGGPVMGHDKIIYFGTCAAPWPGTPPNDPCYETNAVYAVDTSGHLVWRYPSTDATLSNWVLAPPAISSDGRTLYVATFGLDTTVAGQLLALDLSQPADATDGQRLKWSLELRNHGRLFNPFVYVRALAVGADDRIYCAGDEPHFLGSSPAFFAADDRGDRGELAWGGKIVEPQGYPSATGQFCGGLALREAGGDVQTVFVSTTHFRTANGEGGALFAVRPSDGTILHSFDPSTLASPGIGGLTSPTLDAAGRVYVGVRGKHPVFAAPAVDGHMYGLSYDPAAGFSVLWDFRATGQLDWVPPVIGAGGGLYFGTTAPFTPGGESTWFTPGQVPANRSPVFYGLFE